MNALSALLSEFTEISANPKEQMNAYLKQGKKVIGCMPYFCPEELVHAAGMIPFGIWGASTQVSEARRYLPAFICSIIQTTLELGIRGDYEGISALMVPILCDSLKSMDGNWRYAVPGIPIISVAHAQNRKIQAGAEFTASQYRIAFERLLEISGKNPIEADVAKSVASYMLRNKEVRRFMSELAKRPLSLKASERNSVFKSGYFMDVEDYTKKVACLADLLAAEPVAQGNAQSIVTCGIIADNSGLLKILDDYGVCIVDDIVTHESLRFRFDAPEADDPFLSLALMIGDIEGCPVLFDPGKKRANMLVDAVRQHSADGVLFVLTKFCDPEEYDIVPMRRILDKQGIRSLTVEIDQQTTDVEQIRTAVETFCEMLQD